jgi:hypothetical protein
MIFPFNKSSNKYGQKKEIFANLKGMTIEATYNEHTKIVTIKKGVPVYDYSDDRENDNFQLFTDLCSNGTIQLGDDKQYYFAEEYSFEPKKFGKNDTAKSASINFITNGSYSGPKS